MPDRDKGAQQARNKRTLLVARTPDGFPQQVKAEADARGTTVSAFVVGAVTREMQGPGGGKTAPARRRDRRYYPPQVPYPPGPASRHARLPRCRR